MRVAIDCRKLADFGIGTYVRGLIAALATIESGDEYIAIVHDSDVARVPPPIRPLIVNAPNYGVRELFAVGRAVRRERLDLYHAPHVNVPFVDVPIVVTLHDMIPFHASRVAPVEIVHRAMIRRAARRSAVVLTVSEASKRSIIDTLGLREEKIFVTANGVDEIFFHSEARSGAARPYVMYAGNDKPHKNMRGVLAAYEILRRRHPELRLVVAGANFDSFRGIAGVESAGFVTITELAALYRGAEVVLLPSFEEGFGLPAVEAMAAGAPVVVSSTPALREVTADAAIQVDPYSPDAIAAGVDRILSDDVLREDLRRRGRARARQFTWERCARLTIDAYRAALSTRA